MSVQSYLSYALSREGGNFPEDITKGAVNLSTLSAANSTLSAQLSTATANQATLSSALSVCVADGASPTQAHVSTAEASFVTLQSALSTTAVDAAVVSTGLTNLNSVLQGDELLLLNTGVGLTTEGAVIIGEAFERRLTDSNYGPADLKSI